MTLVKLASPGVPDFYQGNEILDYSLVDPDNRRPVDYALRRALLDSLQRLEADAAQPLGERMRDLFAIAVRRSRETVDRLSPAAIPAAQPGAVRCRHLRAADGERKSQPACACVRAASRQHGLVAVAGRLFASIGLAVGEVPLGSTAWATPCWRGRSFRQEP